jgi:RNA polymerase sigma factor for flagellar operon FliA
MVLVLYYFEHLKFSEIGEMIGVSESRICQIHMSAIDAIRDSMR